MLASVAFTTATAQPQARRQQQQTQAKKSNADNMTTRAQISFPTQTKMDEDVVWRRDIYRELDLMDDANAGLYYPKTIVGTQMNLFAYIFKLVMRGQLKAYEYRTDGNEVFTDSARVKPLQFLDDQGIYYTRTERGMTIDNSDIPSEEVKRYYVKESTYYDQVTATFHTKVQALCPIRVMGDDFGDAEQRALFWVKYEDLAPFLSKQTMMTSNLNNAATMSVDDYFTKNLYKGTIYKTNNMQGTLIGNKNAGLNDDYAFSFSDDEDNAPAVAPVDSTVTKEQQRIESQIKSFEQNMWGDQARKDSLDSIAKMAPKDKKALKKQNRRAATSQASSSGKTSVKKQRSSSSKPSSASGSSARMSVRRERH